MSWSSYIYFKKMIVPLQHFVDAKYNNLLMQQFSRAVHDQEIMKIHQQIGPKTQKSIKIGKNEPRAEKVAPRIGNGAEKGQAYMRFGPLQKT